MNGWDEPDPYEAAAGLPLSQRAVPRGPHPGWTG